MPGLVMERVVRTKLQEKWRTSLDEAAIALGWSASSQWFAAATASGIVHLFEAGNGREVRRWNAHRFGAIALAWHPTDDLLASSGQDGKAVLWRPDEEVPCAVLACGTGWVEHLAWSPSGLSLATACGKQLQTWSSGGDPERTFAQQPNTIAGLEWKADSKELVTACYGQVVFWSVNADEPKRTLLWKGSMVSLAWSPDGRYLCHGNQDATVHFWVVATGKELQMSGYPLKVAQLCWDSRSKYLATAGSPQITVWDCSGKGPRGSTPQTLKHHVLPLRALRYQQDGPLLASGCAGGQVAIWRPSKRSTPDAFAKMGAPITEVAWSKASGDLAAATEEGTVVIFETQRSEK